MEFPFILGLCIAILIAIRVLANYDHILGKICRWYWNTSFKIAAFIPFCGWMAHFIIGKKEKEQYIRIGEQADKFAFDMVESAAERERIQQERDERIRQEIARQYGGTNVSVSGDGSYATYQDAKGRSCQVQIRWED